jgi:hypothetical protein
VRAVIAIMKYFERQALDNSSFQYFKKINKDHEIINIIWADVKMIVDYI